MVRVVDRADNDIETARPPGRRPAAATASPRKLTLLGSPALDGQPLGSATGSAARIVVYLALHGSTTRSRLATALWPDVPDERAHGSLRTGLWRLHRTHRGLVQPAAGLIGLDPNLTVDYHELTRAGRALLLQSADARLDPADGYAGMLRLAAAELLPGWDEEWVIHEQERLRQLRLHALESLSAHLHRQGVYGIALEAALIALACDPLRESAHRAVIEVHLAEGNVGEARRQYLACLRVLRGELGLPPSRALLELGRQFGFNATPDIRSMRAPAGVARSTRPA
jgi:DNA-binding SARP family transcriptional activator